jgi:hypothetical protein
MVTIMTITMTINIILIALFGTRDHIDSAIMLTRTITPRIGPASQATVLHVRACARHATTIGSLWPEIRAAVAVPPARESGPSSLNAVLMIRRAPRHHVGHQMSGSPGTATSPIVLKAQEDPVIATPARAQIEVITLGSCLETLEGVRKSILSNLNKQAFRPSYAEHLMASPTGESSNQEDSKPQLESLDRLLLTFQEWNSELNCLASRGEYNLRTATIGRRRY